MENVARYPWEGSELEPDIKIIKEKILSALKVCKTTPSEKEFDLVLFMSITKSENKLLEYLGEKAGDDVVNRWLVDVLVESGRYVTDGKGQVQPV